MEKLIEKIPTWLLALSVFGFFVLIAVSIYSGKPFTIAGLEFGAIEKPDTQKESLPVGSIIASVLSPSDFSHHYGNDWIIADGEEVDTGTDYYKITGRKRIPDLRGRFLRGMDEDASVDPQSGREVGSLQDDSTRLPTSPFSIASSGSHSHTGTVGAVRTTKHAHLDGGSQIYPLDAEHRLRTPARPLIIEESGNHTHSVSGGDGETRPKNVAVYFYIRINGKGQ